MIEQLTDRFDAFAARHSRLFGFAGAGLLVLSSAAYAGFVTLPELEFLTGRSAIIAAAIYNALWWGFINPRIEQRRTLRDAAASETATSPPPQ